MRSTAINSLFGLQFSANPTVALVQSTAFVLCTTHELALSHDTVRRPPRLDRSTPGRSARRPQESYPATNAHLLIYGKNPAALPLCGNQARRVRTSAVAGGEPGEPSRSTRCRARAAAATATATAEPGACTHIRARTRAPLQCRARDHELAAYGCKPPDGMRGQFVRPSVHDVRGTMGDRASAAEAMPSNPNGGTGTVVYRRRHGTI